MKLLILLIATPVFAFMPLVDGQRIDLDYVQTEPFWLGLTENIQPTDILISTTVKDYLIVDFFGTDTQIVYLEPRVVRFYENGTYVGQITPEPASVALLAIGAILIRNRK